MATYLVHITNSPAFSNREVDGDFTSLEISPVGWLPEILPAVIFAVVQTGLVVVVAVAASGGTLGTLSPCSALVSQMPWSQGVDSLSCRRDLSV